MKLQACTRGGVIIDDMVLQTCLRMCSRLTLHGCALSGVSLRACAAIQDFALNHSTRTSGATDITMLHAFPLLRVFTLVGACISDVSSATHLINLLASCIFLRKVRMVRHGMSPTLAMYFASELHHQCGLRTLAMTVPCWCGGRRWGRGHIHEFEELEPLDWVKKLRQCA